jgi:sigma-B regulation protein RsbU (phosphoserine phosphatase)
MRSTLRPKVLLFDADVSRCDWLAAQLQQHGLPTQRIALNRCDPAQLPGGLDVAMFVFDLQATAPDHARVDALIERLRADKVATILWGAPETTPATAVSCGPGVERLDAGVSLDAVLARLETVARYEPMIKQLDRELKHLHRLSKQLNRYFDDIDKEMRLAGRLQKDFMPRKLPQIPPLKFAHLFRPAGWVSGDIFDVFKIDDTHAGMFIADAMGHGTAAGLMTMFLRRALVARRLHAGSYQIVTPPDAMCDLHNELARLELPNFQFITSAYAVINTETLEFRVARGGHPYPIHVNAAGELRELQSEGGLLGLSELEPEFDELAVTLAPGDKIIFYTDGLEDMMVSDRSNAGQTTFAPELRGWSRGDAQGVINAIAGHLDHSEGSLNPEDDVTVVVMEVQPRQTPSVP